MLEKAETEADQYKKLASLNAEQAKTVEDLVGFMELTKAIIVFGVLALLLVAGDRAIWLRKKPSMRLIVILGALLVAVLALVLGYPGVAREIFGGGPGAGLAK